VLATDATRLFEPRGLVSSERPQPHLFGLRRAEPGRLFASRTLEAIPGDTASLSFSQSVLGEAEDARRHAREGEPAKPGAGVAESVLGEAEDARRHAREGEPAKPGAGAPCRPARALA
jgi:hypothetical protein